MIRQITIQHTPGCPNLPLAWERVEAAISQLGGSAPAVTVERIADPEDGTRRAFRGSPAVLFDGVDPFGPAGVPAFACRTYRSDTGIDAAPSVRQILDVLTSGQGD